MFEKIRYENLSSRQKESFNFQKVAAHLADYSREGSALIGSIAARIFMSHFAVRVRGICADMMKS